MTQETGNQQTEKKPWESDWIPKAKQLVTETVDNVKKTVEGVKMPWEDTWKEKPKATPQQGVTEAPTPIKPIPTEAAMIKAAQLSPKEQAKDAAREKSAGNIAELKAEIAKTKDPKIKKVLEDYLKSLGASEKSIEDIKDKGGRKLKTLLSHAEKNSDFRTLYDFLKDSDQVPNIEVGYLSEGTSGRFEYQNSFTTKDKGTITIAGDSRPFVSTFVHEMTHAVDRELRKLGYELNQRRLRKEKLTPDELQFSENWQKSFGSRTIGEGGGEAVGMKSLMKAVADPVWLKDNSDYRTTRNESIAHAVGNSQPEKVKEYFRLQTHMDPSIATEFMILLEQAKKIMKKGK